MRTQKRALRTSLAVAALTAGVSMAAHAEYRCKAPSMPEDKRACDLAKQGRPDELRWFIQRTSSIYGLYFYDYVTPTDFDRWHAARRDDRARSIATADNRHDGRSISR